MSPWGQGDDQLSAGGRTQNRGVSSVTRLVSTGGLHRQDGSCLPTAPPPGTDCPWLWTRPRDPRLQTGLGVSAEPRFCRQLRPLLTALPQECVTWDGDCVIQETFRVFLGACSGNVARTAAHTAVHILGRLPESWAARGQPQPPSREDWPPGDRPPPPLWRTGGNVLGLASGSRGGRGGCWGRRSPTQAQGPAGQTLSLSLGDRHGGQIPFWPQPHDFGQATVLSEPQS